MSSLNPLIWSAAGMAVAAFFVSWAYVARERSGGGSGVYWIKAFVGRFQDPFPRRVKIFRSPAAAQFWFEWQRFGLVLPLLVGAILVALIIPISLYMRNETDSTVRTLLVTLAMPIVFAWPIGKGFSKPDFWSQDLSLSPFVAVRPITTVDLVLIKMKVAGVSAALSWLLVLIFLCVWLPLWGNLELLTRAGSLVRQSYGASSFPQYAIAMLLLVAAVFLTWRFLVGGLWLGLSGNKKAFMISALPYLFSPMIMIIGLFLLFGRRSAPDFSNIDLDRIPVLEVIAALAVIVKFSLWVFSWRDVAGERVNQYFLFWIGSTLSMLLLAILLWVVARPHLPDDADGVRNLLLLIAVLIVPLARIGHAPAALAKNRHR